MEVALVIKIKPATEQNVRLWVIWLKADLRRLGREPDLTGHRSRSRKESESLL